MSAGAFTLMARYQVSSGTGAPSRAFGQFSALVSASLIPHLAKFTVRIARSSHRFHGRANRQRNPEFRTSPLGALHSHPSAMSLDDRFDQA